MNHEKLAAIARARAVGTSEAAGSKGSQVYPAFLQMENAAFADGALPKKTKELIAIGIAVRRDCASCLQWPIEQAATAGASGREVLEAVEVGIAMSGGLATVSARPALAVMAAVFADGPKDGAGGLAAAGPILAPARATAVRPVWRGVKNSSSGGWPLRFVPNRRPIPPIRRRAAYAAGKGQQDKTVPVNHGGWW